MTLGKTSVFLRKCLIFFAFMMAILSYHPNAQAASSVNVIQKAESVKTSTKNLVTTKKGVRYKLSTGKYAQKKWLKIGKSYYYFGSDGYAKTGWFKYGGQRYYASKTGKLFISTWFTKEGKTYYLKSDGAMAAGIWLSKSSKLYRFRSDGTLICSMAYKVKGKIYYADKNGVRVKNKWVKAGNNRYYYGSDGVRVTSKWIKTDGKWYYVLKSGAMAVNMAVGEYYVDANGERHKPAKHYVFVGDSRIVGMQDSCAASNTDFIGKISIGYDWMMSSAIYQLASVLKKYPTSKVIMCFGINDIGNCSKYINAYRTLVSKYPNAKFYFMSVNPINAQLYASHFSRVNVTTAMIKEFNKQLKLAFPTKYLDTYTWLEAQGFETRDGIHYTADTYRKLYSYTLMNIA